MKLKYKLPLILFLAFAAIIAITFTIILSGAARQRQAAQYEMGRATAAAKSEAVKSYFDIKIAELKLLEAEIVGLAQLNDETKLDILKKILRSLSDRPVVCNVFVVFDRGAYFRPELTEPGTAFNIDAFHPEAGGDVEIFVDESYEIDDDDDWYHVPKRTMKLHLMEPYEWTYDGETNARRMITLSIPLIIDGKFVGVAGIDMELKQFQDILFERMANPATNAYAMLVSNNGLRAVHPREAMLLVEIGHDMEPDEQATLKGAIATGKYHRVVKANNQTGDVSLISYVPMQPDGISLPWSLAWILSLSTLQAEWDRELHKNILMAVFCTIAWGVFLLVFMSVIFGNVSRTVEALGKMTEKDGDLTIRLRESGKDEFGQMARGLNGLIEKLHTTIRTTQKESRSLLETSSTLLELSKNLSDSSETTFEQSLIASQESTEASESVREIASEAEHASHSAGTLASTADQMGTNVSSVVDAVDDMNRSFNKMTSDARESKNVASEAITRVTGAVSVVEALGESAREIGQFTNVIMSIANKTNLLALNATVEAARAGEAGKGFAVVAGEVKQLANQSAENADDITQRIESIQTGTMSAVNAIKEVSVIIAKIDTLANSISESIEQQLRVSDDLANSAKQTNDGAKQVVKSISEIAGSIQVSAKNAGETAEGSKNVSESIGVIHENAKKTNSYSMELKEAANSLKSMAEHLDSIVCKFKT